MQSNQFRTTNEPLTKLNAIADSVRSTTTDFVQDTSETTSHFMRNAQLWVQEHPRQMALLVGVFTAVGIIGFAVIRNNRMNRILTPRT